MTDKPLLRREAHPAITHCDNCGCDWLDNGLNPIGCPYCKQPASVNETMLRMEERVQRDEALLRQALEALELFDRFRRMLTDGPDTSDKLLAEDYAEMGFVRGVDAIAALRERLGVSNG